MKSLDAISEYLTTGYFTGADLHSIAFDIQPGGTLEANITGLNEGGQQLARWALEAWTTVSGINFSFVTHDDADLIFTDDEESGAYSQSTELGGNIITSRVNVPASWLTQYGDHVGTGTFKTYLHEIGHALGLGHPGPYPRDLDNPTRPVFWFSNEFPNDSYQISVMSYFSQADNPHVNASFAIPVTPMIADILAIHELYGAPESINAGNSRYGYNSNVGGYLQTFFEQWTARPTSPPPPPPDPDTGGDTNTPTDTGTPAPAGTNPFTLRGSGAFSAVDASFSAAPALADLDGDGDLDLLVGNDWLFNDSLVLYFENTGTAQTPAFTARTGADSPFASLNLPAQSAPALADLDGDGDLDMVVGSKSGVLSYFENTGSASRPAFTARSASPAGINPGNNSKPALIDLDGDNDHDLVIGTAQGRLSYYENTGTASSPAYTQRTGGDNPFNHINLAEDAAPALADMDNDGDPDLIVGLRPGGFEDDTLYYENTGTATAPAFAANPTWSLDMFGFSSTPTLADIDGDNDVDLIIGDDAGALTYYQNSTVTSAYLPGAIEPGARATLTIVDTGGTDTLDLRTDAHNQRIDLRPEGVSDVYGAVGNLIIARGTVIERVIAGSGNDMIRGNDANNLIMGMKGNDIMQGGAGRDTFKFYPNQGKDIILGFTRGEDKIDLRPFEDIDDITDLSGTDTDDGLVIWLSEDQAHSVTLLGLERTDMTADDFLF